MEAGGPSFVSLRLTLWFRDCGRNVLSFNDDPASRTVLFDMFFHLHFYFSRNKWKHFRITKMSHNLPLNKPLPTTITAPSHHHRPRGPAPHHHPTTPLPTLTTPSANNAAHPPTHHVHHHHQQLKTTAWCCLRHGRNSHHSKLRLY